MCRFRKQFFFIELLQCIVDVPKPPGLRLIETDATSAKLELEDVATESSDIVQPLLWCSIFHRAKFGQPEETLLPARNLISLTIKGLKCGTTYRSERKLSENTLKNSSKEKRLSYSGELSKMMIYSLQYLRDVYQCTGSESPI